MSSYPQFEFLVFSLLYPSAELYFSRGPQDRILKKNSILGTSSATVRGKCRKIFFVNFPQRFRYRFTGDRPVPHVDTKALKLYADQMQVGSRTFDSLLSCLGFNPKRRHAIGAISFSNFESSGVFASCQFFNVDNLKKGAEPPQFSGEARKLPSCPMALVH